MLSHIEIRIGERDSFILYNREKTEIKVENQNTCAVIICKREYSTPQIVTY